MAIQFTDFSKAPLLDSPAKTIFEDVLKGYQMSQEPAKMKEEQSARQLANQLKKLDVEHKPKEYELDDKGKIYANALKAKALEHYDEKFKADMEKAKRAGAAAGLRPNGAVANQQYIFEREKAGAPPEEIAALKAAFNAGLEHTEATTDRSKTLNKTQYQRDATPITKQYNELKSIQDGKFPGTDRPLSPEEQKNMQSSLMLNIVKQTTDPKTREKLINANNMNITLDSVDSAALSDYSGLEGQIDKLGDSLLESVGEGSPRYQKYIENVNKANFAAKQMRQYLGDSIQPAAQAKLDKLTKPEAWNVSPATAKKNFDFMRELYKQESQTLVRAISDPTLYQGIGVGNNPAKNNVFTTPAQKAAERESKTGSFNFADFPVAGGK